MIIRCASLDRVRRICSVKVAREQCSRLLEGMAIEFIEFPSTVEAFEAFKEDVALDAVLIAPDSQELDGGLTIALKETANPNNFTAFALLKAPNAENMTVGKILLSRRSQCRRSGRN